MAEGPTTPRTNGRILVWVTAMAVALLAGGGFTLSFSSLIDLATLSGIDRQLAFLWPLIVDGFIVVATGAAFALKGRSPRMTWYPWTALSFFAAISVIGNAVHASQVADLRVPIVLATAVSAIPAIALLVATHLLVVMVDANTRQPVAPAAPVPTVGKSNDSNQELVAALQAARDAGQPLTGALVAALAGTSVRTGRRRLAALREQFPNQLQKPSDSVEGA
ncbi:DUF2637 domain-containing protein [Rathayibacter sp. KR2-224]|uniref:DUF2637 domain-containing protein n=1 Tax=Rathayibacter sp. KR2-224 TaxID=3400913 RepID=UPI003BFFC486